LAPVILRIHRCRPTDPAKFSKVVRHGTDHDPERLLVVNDCSIASKDGETESRPPYGRTHVYGMVS
jgi:hypothetical protein